MNAYRAHHCAASGLIGWVLAAWLIPLMGMAVELEERFPLLQIGTRTYTNVTVTTKAKSYIFIVYAGGMTSVKTADLTPELKQQLGYGVAVTAKANTNSAAVWAKQSLAKIGMPSLKQLNEKWHAQPPVGLSAMGLTGFKLVIAALGVTILIYLFYCYCCMLICQKTGNSPGILVWLPVVQLFPLLRAAGMSGWWFLAYCLPVMNIVAQILWSLNIAKARGQNCWVGVLLLLPIINLFAFLYLAFAGGAREEESEEPEPKIMTLEAA